MARPANDHLAPNDVAPTTASVTNNTASTPIFVRNNRTRLIGCVSHIPSVRDPYSWPNDIAPSATAVMPKTSRGRPRSRGTSVNGASDKATSARAPAIHMPASARTSFATPRASDAARARSRGRSRGLQRGDEDLLE